MLSKEVWRGLNLKPAGGQAETSMAILFVTWSGRKLSSFNSSGCRCSAVALLISRHVSRFHFVSSILTKILMDKQPFPHLFHEGRHWKPLASILAAAHSPPLSGSSSPDPLQKVHKGGAWKGYRRSSVTFKLFLRRPLAGGPKGALQFQAPMMLQPPAPFFRRFQEVHEKRTRFFVCRPLAGGLWRY